VWKNGITEHDKQSSRASGAIPGFCGGVLVAHHFSFLVGVFCVLLFLFCGFFSVLVL